MNDPWPHNSNKTSWQCFHDVETSICALDAASAIVHPGENATHLPHGRYDGRDHKSSADGQAGDLELGNALDTESMVDHNP